MAIVMLYPGTDFSPLYFMKEGLDKVDHEEIIRETKNDETLKDVMRLSVVGWPSNGKNLSDELNRYFIKRQDITVDRKCLYWGNRIIIPESVRGKILSELHRSHLGIVKIKALARSYSLRYGAEKTTSHGINTMAVAGEAVEPSTCRFFGTVLW